MLPSLLGGVAPVLQHGHDHRDAQQHEHNGAGEAARLVDLPLGLVRALTLLVGALGRPGVLLACTAVRLMSSYWKQSLLLAQHSRNISCYMLHVLLAVLLALCVCCTPPAVHQGLPCMVSASNPSLRALTLQGHLGSPMPVHSHGCTVQGCL